MSETLKETEKEMEARRDHECIRTLRVACERAIRVGGKSIDVRDLLVLFDAFADGKMDRQMASGGLPVEGPIYPRGVQ